MSIEYEYIIVGGGITGVTIARLLQLSGVKSFIILESTAEPGGLCKTRKIGGHFLDTGGGHFLCTKHPEVYDFVFSHIPKSDFNYFNRISTIRIGDSEVDYPLESNIWQLPLEERVAYLISVIRNAEARGVPAPQNFEAWCRWKLGDMITDSYMLPYNRKIWGVDPEEMDIDWLHKIPRLNIEEIVRSCLSMESDRRSMPSHAGFYYPKKGGFQEVFDAIMAPVKSHMETSVQVTTLNVEGALVVVNGKYRAKRLINTAPWHSLADSPIFPQALRRTIQELRNNSVVVSLHEEKLTTKSHWIYEPDIALKHHRSFYIHNFAPHSASDGVYRETNLKRWDASQSNVFAETNDYAYPIPTVGWAGRIKMILEHCARLNVYGLGRWGQWEYFNSDVCIREAMTLANQLGHTSWSSSPELKVSK